LVQELDRAGQSDSFPYVVWLKNLRVEPFQTKNIHVRSETRRLSKNYRTSSLSFLPVSFVSSCHHSPTLSSGSPITSSCTLSSLGGRQVYRALCRARQASLRHAPSMFHVRVRVHAPRGIVHPLLHCRVLTPHAPFPFLASPTLNLSLCPSRLTAHNLFNELPCLIQRSNMM
jgi:hypothetical protein